MYQKGGSKLGFRNWVHKIDDWQILGHHIFQGRSQYTQITTIDMDLLDEIKHYANKQCHGNYMKRSYYMLEIDILSLMLLLANLANTK